MGVDPLSTPVQATRPRRWIRVAGRAIAAWFLLHIAFVLIDGLRDADAHGDVAVVFGNTVGRDGEPSPRLKGRLDRALELYVAGNVTKIIASGGRGEEGFEEAEVMARYLISHGVAANDVIVDKTGIDTWQTAIATGEIMRAAGLHSVVVVSQAYHITRCKLALRKAAGLREIGSAHARFFEGRDVYSLGREFIAYYAYLFRRAP